MLTTALCKIYYMETLGKRIRQSRKAKGLTQQELADRAGVTRPAITLWESDDIKNLRLDNLFRAADALGVSAKWLATGEGASLADQNEFKPELLELVVTAVHTSLAGSRKKLKPDKMGTLIRLLYQRHIQDFQPTITEHEIFELLDMAS